MNKRVAKKLLFGLSLIAILVLWAIMHIRLLGDIPRGLHIDEAGMAYDAFCIANWGVDRYLNPYPLYFYNYGGGMSAAYVYLCAIFIKIFGTGTIVYRLPGVIFSLITGVSIFFIIRKAYGNSWAVLGSFLYCALPYFTAQSRFGLDCNLMLGAATLATWIFIEALERDKWYLYVLDGLLWGLTLYTYIISYMVLPIFLAVTCSYLLAIKKINFKKLLYAAIPFLIMAFPLIIMAIITAFQLEPIITPFFTIPCINGQRMGEFSLNIFANIPKMFKALFINDNIDYNSLFGFYTFYNISLIFCAIGAIYCIANVVQDIRHRKISISFVMVSYFLAQLVIGSIKTDTNMNNMNGIYFTVLYFIVAGIRTVFLALNRLSAYLCDKFKTKWVSLTAYLKYIALIAIVVVYMINLRGFMNFYFNDYRYITSYLFTPQLEEVYEQYGDILLGRQTYVDTFYIHYILEKEFSPYDLGLKLYQEPTSYGTATFHTIYTPLPDDLSEYTAYIIQESNYDARRILNESGLNNAQVYGYFVYWE